MSKFIDKYRVRAKISAVMILVTIAIPGTAIGGASPVNVITNGDFTTTPFTQNSQFGSAGYSNLSGWTVSANGGSTPFDLWWVASTAASQSALTQYGNTGQELFSSYPGADGASAYFVSLDGDPAATGVLSQTVSGLTVGDHYQLKFDWAATQMTTATNTSYHIAVAYNLGAGALTGNTAYQTPIFNGAYTSSSSGWMTVTTNFTATSSSEILSFLSEGGPSGAPPIALLDGISLVDIPEPKTYSLLLGAVSLLVLVRRRRTANAEL